jgi:hypothetical protein
LSPESRFAAHHRASQRAAGQRSTIVADALDRLCRQGCRRFRQGGRFGPSDGRRLPILSSDEDEALLGQAGSTKVALFYAAFSFRGWIACAKVLPDGLNQAPVSPVAHP